MQRTHDDHPRQISRRALLRGGTLVLAAATVDARSLFADAPQPKLRVGLVTDLHYADKPTNGTRHYRETLDKLAEAAARFEQVEVDLVVELGDLVDAADSVDAERGYLTTVNRAFAAICRDRHYVLGNHCVDTLTKDEFLDGVQQERSYYSFDRAGLHFVVLDSCFRGDGQPYGRKNFQWTDANVPAAELEWLAADLRGTDKPVVVFAHQRLDVSNHHGVKNNAEVRRVLESSGRVLAVLQGHSHKNDVQEVSGIHYCTLRAMVEGSGAASNGYAVMDVDAGGNLRIHGFRHQASHHLS